MSLLDTERARILIITHDYGQDVHVCESQKAAEEKLLEFVHEWWHELLRDGIEDLPEQPPSDPQEAIDTYFGLQDKGEDYTIKSFEVVREQ